MDEPPLRNERRGDASLDVLVLENNCALAKCLRLYLEHLGHHVTVANGIQEAFAFLKLNKPDLLLADVYLDGGTCFTLLAGEKKLPRVVVTMSAFDLRRTERQQSEVLKWPHLIKPFDPKLLDTMLAGVSNSQL